MARDGEEREAAAAAAEEVDAAREGGGGTLSKLLLALLVAVAAVAYSRFAATGSTDLGDASPGEAVGEEAEAAAAPAGGFAEPDVFELDEEELDEELEEELDEELEEEQEEEEAKPGDDDDEANLVKLEVPSMLMRAAHAGDAAGTRHELAAIEQRGAGSEVNAVVAGSLTATHIAVMGRARVVGDAVELGTDPMAGEFEKVVATVAASDSFRGGRGGACPLGQAVQSGMYGHTKHLLKSMTRDDVVACMRAGGGRGGGNMMHDAMRADLTGLLELAAAATNGNAALYSRAWPMLNLLGMPELAERLGGGGRVSLYEAADAHGTATVHALFDALGRGSSDLTAALTATTSSGENPVLMASRVPRAGLLELVADELARSDKEGAVDRVCKERASYGVYAPTVMILADREEVVPTSLVANGYGHIDSSNCTFRDLAEFVGLPNTARLVGSLNSNSECHYDRLVSYRDEAAAARTESQWMQEAGGWATRDAATAASLLELTSPPPGAPPSRFSFAELPPGADYRQVLTALIAIGKPFVVRAGATKWLRRVSFLRSRDGALSELGGTQVRVCATAMSRVSAVPSRTSSFEAYARAWTGNDRDAGGEVPGASADRPPQAVFSKRVSAGTSGARLIENVGDPDGFQLRSRVKEVVVGPAGSGSGPLFRGGLFFQGVVTGSRRVLAFPPSQSYAQLVHVRDWLEGDGAGDARAAPYVLTAEEGDLVFVPPMWMSVAVNLADTVAVEVEYPSM